MCCWELWRAVEQIWRHQKLCSDVRWSGLSPSAPLVHTDRKSLPPGSGRVEFFMLLFMISFISSKYHLGNFIGTEVLKEPGVYNLQEKCLIKMPNSSDFLCVLHCGSCWCQKPLKNHHRWSQKRFLTSRHELSTVLNTNDPIQALPCPCICLVTSSLKIWGQG